MLDALVVTAGILAFGAGLILAVAASSAQPDVHKIAPEYARRLFTFTGRMPIRMSVLFGEEIPTTARAFVQPLRAIAAVFLAFFCTFGASVVAALLGI